MKGKMSDKEKTFTPLFDDSALPHIRRETMNGREKLPEKTLPLVVRTFNERDTEAIMVSVATEHRDWVLKELNANKGVRGVDETYRKTDNEWPCIVYLSARIGKDDWDKLFELPQKLDEHIKEMEGED